MTQTSGFALRALQMRDIAAVQDLVIRTMKVQLSPGVLVSACLVQGHDGYVVEAANTNSGRMEVVGVITGHSETDSAKHIDLLCVHENFRRRGLGRLLIEHFATVGGQQLSLEVARGNSAAHGLYSALGFVDTGMVLPRFYSADDALVMMRPCGITSTRELPTGRGELVPA